MAVLLQNQAKQIRTPQVLTASTSNVYLNKSEYLFYSNSPEMLDSTDMADNGKFLNRASVSGNGQIYTWHANGTGRTINSCILIYNPNAYAVTLKVTNYGLTNDSTQSQPDVIAWEKYYNGQSTSVTVAAGGYGNLFLRTIANGNHFGTVARVNIVKQGTATAAAVTLFDLAYFSNSGNAQSFATPDAATTKRTRGKGAGFYTTITLPTLSPTNTDGIGCSFGSKKIGTLANTYDDSFYGADCSVIEDPSGMTSGPLQGAYGQQFQMTIPIKNTTSIARKFRVFIGSRGGVAFPFVNFAGSYAKYTNRIENKYYVDVIETDTIASGSTELVTLSTVITAMSDAPFFIGVRTI